MCRRVRRWSYLRSPGRNPIAVGIGASATAPATAVSITRCAGQILLSVEDTGLASDCRVFPGRRSTSLSSVPAPGMASSRPRPWCASLPAAVASRTRPRGSTGRSALGAQVKASAVIPPIEWPTRVKRPATLERSEDLGEVTSQLVNVVGVGVGVAGSAVASVVVADYPDAVAVAVQ